MKKEILENFIYNIIIETYTGIKMGPDDKFGNNIKYYHGTDNEHSFDKRGEIYNGTFFSTNKNTAKEYGKFVYEITIKPNLKIFNTSDINDDKILFNNFSKLKDFTFDKNDKGNIYYDENDHKKHYYRKPYITTAEELYEETLGGENWYFLEMNKGVLKWLSKNYDGVYVFEHSVRNLLLFSPIKEKIQNVKLIN